LDRAAAGAVREDRRAARAHGRVARSRGQGREAVEHHQHGARRRRLGEHARGRRDADLGGRARRDHGTAGHTRLDPRADRLPRARSRGACARARGGTRGKGRAPARGAWAAPAAARAAARLPPPTPAGPRFFAPGAPPPPSADPAHSADAPQLRVRRVRAAAYLKSRMVWRNGVEVGFYDLLRWTETPARYAQEWLDDELFERR